MQLILNIFCLTGSWFTLLLCFILAIIITMIFVIFKTRLWYAIVEAFKLRKIYKALYIQPDQIFFRCVHNHNRTIKSISFKLTSFFGYNVADLINDNKQTFASIIHPEDHKLLFQKINSSIQLNNTYQVEYRILTSWGSVRWIIEEGTIKKSKFRNRIYLEGIITDITDKQYMNEVITESESRFHTFLENSPIGICICYNELITYANPQLLYMFRAEFLEDILGFSPKSLIIRDKQDEFEKLLRNEASNDQQQIDISTIGLRLDSTNFPLHAIFAPISEGEFKGKLIFLIDITEIKRKEQALQDSEKKARIIIETIEDIILFVNEDSTILDCNSKFAQRFNLTREDLIGKKAVHLVPKNTFDYWVDKISPIYKTNGPINFEYFSTNGVTTYSIFVYPIKNESGKIESFVVYGHDLTMLKQAEKALRDSELQYRTITESITDYVYRIIIDDEYPKFIFNDTGCERILGYGADDFIQNPGLFLNILMPEDKQMLISHLENCIAHKSKRTIEHRIKHKNGKIVWVSNSIIFFSDSKNRIELKGVLKDITLNKHTEFALLEVERRYRTVFDQSGLATNVFDLNGKLIMQNSLAANMLGGVPLNFIGKNVNEITAPDLAKGIRLAIRKALKNNTFVNESKLDLPTGNYWLKSTAHTIKNSIGENVGVQFISQNVTDKKKYEYDMLNTIIATEERERINFAQELHDGLGPLISAIKIYTQWLSRPDAKLSQQEVLIDMENLINEAGAAIKEISFKLSPHILDNFGFIEAINDYAEKIKRSKMIEINLVNNFAQRLPKTTDSVLYRVLCECINNTLKHANASVIDIRIQKYKRKLKINYTDNGKGFDMDDVLKNRSGNGLYNIQNRIESINGYIVFNSHIGKGTKILIVVRFQDKV